MINSDLSRAIRKATAVEAPPLDPGLPRNLAAVARVQPPRTAGFPAWVIVLSAAGVAAVAALAYFLPITFRFPGSLLAVVPALNLILSPVAAFVLVQRRKRYAA